MKTVVLAGGRGVRMRPLTYSIPKPLLPVGEKPILEIIVESLRDQGFGEFIFTVGYRAELIETYFGDGSKFGVRIDYARESEPMGTAGALSLVRDTFRPSGDEPLLVMNGDILTKLDCRRLVEFHRDQGCDLTVAARRYEIQIPYGVLQVDGERLAGIKEKPLNAVNISAGIYVLQPSVLDLVPTGRPFDMPQLIDALLQGGRAVASYRVTDFWMSLDHMGHLEEATQALAAWSEA